ncbi:hypothetical protein [Mycolicibacterium septicum]|uniref:hypothetical protein n=1 Tax=Mycolicibacterium septicum TaxID=98668 RepID=UPI001AF596E2|nr:hypothetical protein [Mycolicibacterium septicum]QRY51827.1 hypothetical protein JVX95_31385 [Mycolicibacterium septicum]
MTDPAIEAARKVAERYPNVSISLDEGGHLIDSAREALKPIRAEYQDLRAKALASNDTGFVAGLALALVRLAPLLYTTEERA